MVPGYGSYGDERFAEILANTCLATDTERCSISEQSRVFADKNAHIRAPTSIPMITTSQGFHPMPVHWLGNAKASAAAETQSTL
jgi:hypothetical protein